jgi:hypothetical protein
MKIQNSSLYGKYQDRADVWEKRVALTKWLNKDISTWSEKTVHAVYAQEKRKRMKIFMSEFF